MEILWRLKWKVPLTFLAFVSLAMKPLLLTWSVYHICYRSVVQDARDFPHGIPSTICWSLYVLRLDVQHLHEDLLYLSHSLDHIPDEVQVALLHDLWFAWWSIPSLQSLDSSGSRPHLHPTHRLGSVALRLELLLVAWSYRLRPSDSHASQNARRRESHKPLYSRSRPLSLLLHHQLVSLKLHAMTFNLFSSI